MVLTITIFKMASTQHRTSLQSPTEITPISPFLAAPRFTPFSDSPSLAARRLCCFYGTLPFRKPTFIASDAVSGHIYLLLKFSRS